MPQIYGWRIDGAATADIVFHAAVRSVRDLPTQFRDILDHCPAAPSSGVQCYAYKNHLVVHYHHPAGPYLYIIDWAGHEVHAVSLAENLTDTYTLLTSTVVALISRLRGRLTLHGAAMSVGERQIALLAAKGMGKSTTALALLQRGHSMLSDDVVSIQMPGLLIYPGLPETRQTLRTLKAFGINPDEHDPVLRAEPSETQDKRTIALTGGRAAMFCGAAQKLDAIYLLDRTAKSDGPAIASIDPVISLRTLLAHVSFAPQPLMDGEFEMLGKLVGKVPVRRVSYPSDLGQLDLLCDCLEQDRPQSTRHQP